MKPMFARRASGVFLAVLLLFVPSGASPTAPPQSGTRITAMKVDSLEPTDEGEMGTLNDVFANQRGNEPVFMGTGSANYPTRRLLVMVEATGEDYTPIIELTAREGRRVVYRKVSTAYVPSGIAYAAPAKTYAYFFIEGDRCETIRLTARLLRQRRPSTMTKTIKFGCGE